MRVVFPVSSVFTQKKIKKKIHMKSRNKELLSGVVLIWFGLGFNAVLSALKFHWLVCQIVLIVFFAVCT